jgi:thiol-disulfide isomerase/thioredoxin
MNSLKNPGIKYLIKINSLTKELNDFIENKNPKNALNTLYNMRIIHGTVLNLYSTIQLKNKNTNKKFIYLSYINTIINIINEKIINSENNFNIYIKNNNINITDLDNFEKLADVDKLADSDELSESDNLSESDESLPIFDGNKSNDLITREKIVSEIKINNSNEFKNNIPSLLFFFNPGCPACNQTKPHWDKLKSNINLSFESDEKLFNILEFNLADSSNESLSYLFKIEYIPTIIMMESSKIPTAQILKLEGSSDIHRIQNFIKESFIKFTPLKIK